NAITPLTATETPVSSAALTSNSRFVFSISTPSASAVSSPAISRSSSRQRLIAAPTPATAHGRIIRQRVHWRLSNPPITQKAPPTAPATRTNATETKTELAAAKRGDTAAPAGSRVAGGGRPPRVVSA